MICVPLIHALHDGIDVRHEWVGDEEEFTSGVGLEAAHTEEGGFESFDAGDGEVWVGGCEGCGGGGVGWGGFVVEGGEGAGVGVAVGSAGGRGLVDGDSRSEGFGDGVHAMEGPSQDEVVVCGDLFDGWVGGGGKVAVVD
jgi:hypothetical protein